jgi:hypothetical protein
MTDAITLHVPSEHARELEAMLDATPGVQYESKGWITRTFQITGEASSIASLRPRISEWIGAREDEDAW